MATAEQFAQAAQVEQQMALIDWQTERWRLAYDALVGEAQTLRAAIAETRTDLEALRADLATAD